MSRGKIRHNAIPCPCEGCDTVFSGTQLQIANNLKTHYHGKHIKNQEKCSIDKNRKKMIVEIIGDAFEDVIGSFEPEVTVDDEYLITRESQTVSGKKYDLKNYLSIKPVCREERQFALFLANKFSEIKNKSVLNEGWITKFFGNDKHSEPLIKENDEIIEVYYEVTILRDYWYENKRHFNKCLYDYVAEDSNLLRDYCSQDQILRENRVDGSNSKLHANKWVPTFYLARWMMNAKPDIGLIIKNNELYRLTFIECKYMSKEDEYMNSDIMGRLKQTELQEHILNFACNKLNVSYKGKHLKRGQVKLVKFINGINKPEKGEITVPIEDLIT